MGLLDDPNAMANLQLAAGLLSGGNFGQAASRGLSNYAGVMQQAQGAEMKRQYMAAQNEERQSQSQLRKAEAARIESAIKNEINKRGALASIYGSTGEQMSPTAGQSGAAPAQQQAAFNYMAALQAGYSPKEIEDLARLPNAGLAKVVRTIDTTDAQGRPVTMQLDEFGRPIGSGMAQWKAPISVNQGDRSTFINPATLQNLGSLAINQSPDSKASNALGWANNALARERMSMEAGKEDKPQWIESLGGFANPRTQTVMPARDLKGNIIEGAGPKMTEDQAKATGWLVQAENAYGNMQSAAKRSPESMKPGFNDALAAVPSMGAGGALANVFRSSDRQMFTQGASSLSEALLRAATGAGVNKDEAAQKIKEITPSFGDSDEVIKQKMASIPLYIESLKVRSGPGAKKAAGIIGGSPAPAAWGIQKVD